MRSACRAGGVRRVGLGRAAVVGQAVEHGIDSVDVVRNESRETTRGRVLDQVVVERFEDPHAVGARGARTADAVVGENRVVQTRIASPVDATAAAAEQGARRRG